MVVCFNYEIVYPGPLKKISTGKKSLKRFCVRQGLALALSFLSECVHFVYLFDMVQIREAFSLVESSCVSLSTVFLRQ